MLAVSRMPPPSPLSARSPSPMKLPKSSASSAGRRGSPVPGLISLSKPNHHQQQHHSSPQRTAAASGTRPRAPKSPKQNNRAPKGAARNEPNLGSISGTLEGDACVIAPNSPVVKNRKAEHSAKNDSSASTTPQRPSRGGARKHQRTPSPIREPIRPAAALSTALSQPQPPSTASPARRGKRQRGRPLPPAQDPPPADVVVNKNTFSHSAPPQEPSYLGSTDEEDGWDMPRPRTDRVEPYNWQEMLLSLPSSTSSPHSRSLSHSHLHSHSHSHSHSAPRNNGAQARPAIGRRRAGSLSNGDVPRSNSTPSAITSAPAKLFSTADVFDSPSVPTGPRAQRMTPQRHRSDGSVPPGVGGSSSGNSSGSDRENGPVLGGPAYAGAAFHNSPKPTDLPAPRFLRRA